MLKRVAALIIALVILLAPAAAQAEEFTVIWLPDTQKYCGKLADIFSCQTQWIADNREKLNIKYAVHTGDVVQTSKNALQWENADKAFSILRKAGVPLFVIAGNHDSVSNKTDLTNFKACCYPVNVDKVSYYDRGTAAYTRFFVNGMTFMVIGGAYYYQKDEVIKWMDRAIKAHPDDIVILASHSYLYAGKPKRTSDGALLFRDIVTPNKNVKLVICGHTRGANYLASELDDDGDGVNDRTVYQMLSNYQSGKQGGAGYLKIMHFDTEKRTGSVITYSPWLDDYGFYNNKPEKDLFAFTF